MKLKLICTILLIAIVPALKAADIADTIAIICLNDFHGSFVKSDETPGAGNIYTAVKKIKERYPSNIVVSVGDNFGGSYFSLLTGGQPLPFFFNSLGIRYSAIGNHEFDYGQDTFENFGKGTIDYLCGNITKNEELLSRASKRETIELPLKNSPDIVTIDIIGLISAGAKKQCVKKYVEDLNFSDSYMPIISDGLGKTRSNIRILLAHIGTCSLPNEQNKAQWEDSNSDSLQFGTDKIDGIASGHSHKYVCGYINNVPVVQGEISGRFIGVLRFVYTKGKIETCSPIVVRVNETEDKSDTRKEIERRIKTLCETTVVESVKMKLSDVIGTASDAIIHDRNKNPRETTALGTYVCMSYADAYRIKNKLKIEDPVLAFCHFGCIRRSLYPGEISVLTAGELLPFSSNLKVYKLTGKEIFKIIEEGIKNEKGCMQMNNLVVDTLHADAKTRVLNVWYNLPGGEYVALSKNKTYHVVVDEYITTGGDGYSPDLFPKDKCETDTLSGTTDVFLSYLKRIRETNGKVVGGDRILSSKSLYKARIKNFRDD
jgi:2',3'-cyclic-nucleotide 2'-phosphodiesterase (5'-nucleotidase family)